MVKFKNVFGGVINVNGKARNVEEVFEEVVENQELLNLVSHGYLIKVE